MAVLATSPPALLSPFYSRPTSTSPPFHLSFHTTSISPLRRRRLITAVASSHLCNPETPTKLDKSALRLAEAVSEDELWAAACLRIRSFNDFRPSVGVEVSSPCVGFDQFHSFFFSVNSVNLSQVYFSSVSFWMRVEFEVLEVQLVYTFHKVYTSIYCSHCTISCKNLKNNIMFFVKKFKLLPS